MFNQVGGFTPGIAVSSIPGGSLGKHIQVPDYDWSTAQTSVRTFLTEFTKEWVLLQNKSSGTLTKSQVGTYDWTGGNSYKTASGTAGAGARGDFVVDEFLGSAGVPNNYYFWATVRGPTKVFASTATAIAAGAPLMTAASGKVLEDPAGNGGTTMGRAMAASSSSSVAFRASVNFGGGGGAQTTPDWYTASFSVGTETSNAIIVTATLKDKFGTAVASKTNFLWFLSSDTAGDTAPTAPNGTVASSTGTWTQWTSKLSGMARSNATGIAALSMTDTGTPTVYMNIVTPNGTTVQSGAVTWA